MSEVLETVEAWLRAGMPLSFPETTTPNFKEQKDLLLYKLYSEKLVDSITAKMKGHHEYNREQQSTLESTVELAVTMAVQLGPALLAFSKTRRE